MQLTLEQVENLLPVCRQCPKVLRCIDGPEFVSDIYREKAPLDLAKFITECSFALAPGQRAEARYEACLTRYEEKSAQFDRTRNLLTDKKIETVHTNPKFLG